jgi:5'-3' exonuclease
MRVHLIDGTYELFRMFFGAPSSVDDEGIEIGATRAWMRSLAGLLAREDVSHVAVAFDHVIESFRNDLFDGYKTGAGIEPELLAQFPIIEDATRALGVVAWPMVELEADDALAGGAMKYRDQVEQVVLCSPDKDLYQCVDGEKVVLWDRRRDIVMDDQAVLAKVGVEPASIPDYLALVGDDADGIPGIPRWGAKSTATVLAHYRHLEAIPADPSDWAVKVRGAKTLAANLEAQREDAALYKTLATLRTDVPPEESLEDLRWKGPAPTLAAMADRLGAPEVVAKVEALAG